MEKDKDDLIYLRSIAQNNVKSQKNRHGKGKSYKYWENRPETSKFYYGTYKIQISLVTEKV